MEMPENAKVSKGNDATKDFSFDLGCPLDPGCPLLACYDPLILARASSVVLVLLACYELLILARGSSVLGTGAPYFAKQHCAKINPSGCLGLLWASDPGRGSSVLGTDCTHCVIMPSNCHR